MRGGERGKTVERAAAVAKGAMTIPSAGLAACQTLCGLLGMMQSDSHGDSVLGAMSLVETTIIGLSPTHV